MEFLNRKKLLSLIFVVIVICAYAFSHLDSKEKKFDVGDLAEEVAVHFIDVGQGDCALIQSADVNILIDSGPPSCRDDLFDYIDSLGVETFEYAIFTHPHSDHIGPADKVVEKYEFKNVILPDAISTSGYYERLLDALDREECNVISGEAGKSFDIGDIKLELFAPYSYYDKSDINDMSVVCKLTYKDASFLFTGDAESFSEKQMLANGCDLDVDVLKVGHHGSNSSSKAEFLEAVSPQIAIISAGEDNDYGHPHREVVERLENNGIETYITCEVGSIVVITDGKEYNIKH